MIRGLFWVLVFVAFALAITAVFFQFAWNHGVTHAFDAHAISYPTAFWVNALVLWLASRVKSTTTNAIVRPPPQ